MPRSVSPSSPPRALRAADRRSHEEQRWRWLSSAQSLAALARALARAGRGTRRISRQATAPTRSPLSRRCAHMPPPLRAPMDRATDWVRLCRLYVDSRLRQSPRTCLRCGPKNEVRTGGARNAAFARRQHGARHLMCACTMSYNQSRAPALAYRLGFCSVAVLRVLALTSTSLPRAAPCRIS